MGGGGLPYLKLCLPFTWQFLYQKEAGGQNTTTFNILFPKLVGFHEYCTGAAGAAITFINNSALCPATAVRRGEGVRAIRFSKSSTFFRIPMAAFISCFRVDASTAAPPSSSGSASITIFAVAPSSCCLLSPLVQVFPLFPLLFAPFVLSGASALDAALLLSSSRVRFFPVAQVEGVEKSKQQQKTSQSDVFGENDGD